MIKTSTYVMWVCMHTMIAAAQDHATPEQERHVYPMDKVVVVTADRLSLSYLEIARSVVVIDQDDIENFPVVSLEGLLAHVAGVDIRQRGSSGVQADISMRGGGFQQTLILIDGVKARDPQSGHHSLDLPITLADIDRIEILKGPGSKLYGPDAVNGVINIITRSFEKSRINLELTAGDFGLTNRLGSLSYSSGRFSHRLSFGQRNSAGHRDNTEFDITTLTHRTDVSLERGRLSLISGYGDKKFGAHRFYSDNYPDEWESTETVFLALHADLITRLASIAPKIYWKRHEDDFVLDRNRPDWYRNKHTTNQYGTEFQAIFDTFGGIAVVGAELAGEEIESTNLGDHSRTRGGIFFEERMTPTPALSIVPGFSLYYHSGDDWRWWPGLDLGYKLTEFARLFFSLGKSYRLPTYTELYYTDPANKGNTDLYPEKAWTYELGVNIGNESMITRISGFLHEGENLIDWVRENQNDPWQAKNITSVTTYGLEIEATQKIDRIILWSSLAQISARYTYLDLNRSSDGSESKYILDHLKHQLVVDIYQNWLPSIQQTWSMRYLKRFGADDYIITDTRISYKTGQLGVFMEVVNLFDASYHEVGTIPMPGSWFRGGIKYEIPLPGPKNPAPL